MAAELGRDKADAIAASGATVVASANPGCTVQLSHHLANDDIDVVHPVELLDRAMG
jgi:glycolate oxidase iron-sulfur subunit